jgi:hypothetical protein
MLGLKKIEAGRLHFVGYTLIQSGCLMHRERAMCPMGGKDKRTWVMMWFDSLRLSCGAGFRGSRAVLGLASWG